VAYRIELKTSVNKDFRPIPSQDIERIISKIDSLATDPRPAGASKLVGTQAWRVRTGNYRIIYQIDEQTQSITIIKIGHRNAVYR
jgi:mRNA interferase RelE/StbE